jgi:hypothetical protein
LRSPKPSSIIKGRKLDKNGELFEEMNKTEKIKKGYFNFILKMNKLKNDLKSNSI